MERNYAESAEFSQWMRNNDPDGDTAAKLAARLDAAIADRSQTVPVVDLSISPLECILLAETGEDARSAAPYPLGNVLQEKRRVSRKREYGEILLSAIGGLLAGGLLMAALEWWVAR